jgi:transposase
MYSQQAMENPQRDAQKLNSWKKTSSKVLLETRAGIEKWDR